MNIFRLSSIRYFDKRRRKKFSQAIVQKILFFLFNGIATFLGYLMPNPSFLKDSGGTI